MGLARWILNNDFAAVVVVSFYFEVVNCITSAGKTISSLLLFPFQVKQIQMSSFLLLQLLEEKVCSCVCLCDILFN